MTSAPASQDRARGVPFASPTGHGVVAAAILGSGIAFLDGSVVNVALPAIGQDLGGGFATLQWVLDAYLLTLSALLLLGGALGDRYGRRRIFSFGLVVFTAASLACGLAPGGLVLILARSAQGVGGALLVPGSLALIDATIRPDDRDRAIGVWAGLTGVASAAGPLIGGLLVAAVSWRLVFFVNVPIAAAAVAIVLRHVPESQDDTATGPPDVAGAASITLGLSGLVFALVQGPAHGWSALPVTAAVVGAVAFVTFPFVERRQHAPLLPLALFRSSQFTGANVTTFAVYAALGGALFLLTLQLQLTLRYSPVAAGLATLPTTLSMLLLSGQIGGLVQRTGPRLPMTIGPLVAGAGLALLANAMRGASYLGGVFPGVTVFGLGLAITVAPLTSAVLAAVDEQHVGAASGANNAISRLAGLLSVAVLPLAAGLHHRSGGTLGAGFATAMYVSAALCGLGAVVAAFTVGRATPVRTHTLPAINQACQAPSTREPRAAET